MSGITRLIGEHQPVAIGRPLGVLNLETGRGNSRDVFWFRGVLDEDLVGAVSVATIRFEGDQLARRGLPWGAALSPIDLSQPTMRKTNPNLVIVLAIVADQKRRFSGKRN